MNESSTEYKKIVFIVVVVSAIVSLITFMGLSMWAELSAGNEKLEKLEITSCLWSENMDSANISIQNTGETALRISQISINDILLSQEEWICYPSSKLEPGDEAYVSVSPSLITFEEGKIYVFGLTTESRKTFKRTFVAPKTFPFVGTEQLEIQGCSFNAGNANITLSVQNTGTADLTVSKYKIGVSGTITNLPQEVPVAQGDSESVTVPLAWSSGTTYDIYLVTSTGKQFPYRATAPEGATAGKMIKFDSAYINATSDNVTIYVRNWGTEPVTLDKVYIDGDDHTTSVISPTGFPIAGVSLSVDAVVKITVNGTDAGLDFTAGNTYEVKVAGPGVEWEESVEAS